MIGDDQRRAARRSDAPGRAAAPSGASVASRFCAAMRPTASMIFGFSNAIWRVRYGRQARHLLRLRVAIAGRAALEHVGDEDVARAARPMAQQHGIEQLAGALRRRVRPAVLLRAGRLADHQPVARCGRRRRTRSACASGAAAQRVQPAAPRCAAPPSGAAGAGAPCGRGPCRRGGRSAARGGTAAGAAACSRRARGTQRSMPSASRYCWRRCDPMVHAVAGAGGAARRRRRRRPTHSTGADKRVGAEHREQHRRRIDRDQHEA